MIARFFIDRPVLANVLAIVIVVIGLVALFALPVSQYPDIVPPTVQVTTRYPGASAQTVIDTVAQPIEQQVNGVEGMLYMQSTSTADGSYTLTVTFAIGTDLDFAQVLVQNRVSSALASLPQAVQAQGVTVQKKSTAILQIITLTGSQPNQDSLYLSNYATINLRDELSRVPGVGNVTVFGAGQYAMRVWLDPQKMSVMGVSTAEVVQAVQEQNQQVAAGQIGQPPVPTGQEFQFTVNTLGRLMEPKEFADIIWSPIATLKLWAQEHPRVVEQYVKSLNQANTWMRGNRDEAVRLLRPYFPETDEETLHIAFNALIPAVREDGKLSEAEVRNQIEVFKTVGTIDSSPDTKEGILWTNQYNR